MTCATCALGRAYLRELLGEPRRGLVPNQHHPLPAMGGQEAGNSPGLPDGSPPKRYVDWADAGGPNECAHGYAEGIPCPRCEAEAGPISPVEDRTYPISAVAAAVEGTRYPAGGLHEPQGVGPQVSSGGGGANPPDGSFGMRPPKAADGVLFRPLGQRTISLDQRPRLRIELPGGAYYQGDGE